MKPWLPYVLTLVVGTSLATPATGSLERHFWAELSGGLLVTSVAVIVVVVPWQILSRKLFETEWLRLKQFSSGTIVSLCVVSLILAWQKSKGTSFGWDASLYFSVYFALLFFCVNIPVWKK